MRGVPADLDLGFLHGAEVVQLCFGRHQVQVHFHPSASLGVEGRWELEDESGQLLDSGAPAVEGDSCPLLRLLGRRVVGSSVAAPGSFVLEFDGVLRLRVYDRSTEFESFSLQPGNIFI